MKLTPPFPLSTIDNGFGPSTSPAVNAYYESLGLKGHPGVDYDVPWGTNIPAASPCTVSALLSEGNPNLMAFRAVNTIVEAPEGCYEVQYGHVNTMYVKVGDILKTGDLVATVGNTGDVFECSAGKCVEVTAAQKSAGSHLGSHLHFQVRVLNKVPADQPNVAGIHYLNDGVGELILNGFKYQIQNYDNGENGCVDPAIFFPGGLEDVVKAEVAVDNATTDPSVKASLEKEIAEGVEKITGITI
jgi:murein DD-endopeptidase MepM/ murein hydrolase activator NlpD